MLDEWNAFQNWMIWKDTGGRRPRPPEVWTRVPSWESTGDSSFSPWVLRRELVRARGRRPEPLPPLAPPPVSVPPLGTFAGPGVWLSPEIRSLGWTGAEIARRAAAVGAKWIALDAAVNETGDANLRAFPYVAHTCADVGIKVGLWADNPSAVSAAERVHRVSAPFYIMDAEADTQVPDQDGVLYVDEMRRLCPDVELALTPFSWDVFPNPLLVGEDVWKQRTEPWTRLPCLIQCYVSENPPSTPEAQAVQASQRRFQAITCVLESNTEHGWSLDTIDEAEVRRYYGRAVSLYMLGSALDRDLQKFIRLARG